MLNNVNDLELIYGNEMVSNVMVRNAYHPVWEPLARSVDGNIRARYGNRFLLEYYKLVEELEVREDFEVILYAFLKSKEHEYKTLYELLHLEYNPIENYSMTEVEEGTNSTDNMYGSKTEREQADYGEKIVSVTDNYGNQQNVETVDYGETNTNTSGDSKVAPFDSSNYENLNKNTTTSNVEARTDTTTNTKNAYVDKSVENVSQHADSRTHTTDEHADTLHTSFDRNLTRSGNIGVTTSQQMISSSIDLAPRLNFIDRVSKDVVNLISKGVYYVL